jgi:cytochrome c oxidase subunit IV
MATDTQRDHAEHSAHDDHEEHWPDWKYVQLAIGLALITAVEVLLSYIRDDMGPVFLPALLLLMAVKFFAVVMFFMHLKFDNKIFGLMFYTGLGLAVFVYIVALFTFHVFSN